jgi:ATP-dependent Zn protease
VYAKARKIVMHGEGTTTVMLSDEELLSCAVHEAGHAVVCDAAGRDFNLASIIEDDPSRLGCVEQAKKTRCTSASILASIDIALAGLVGQEVMGLSPSGGESDLKMANQLAFDYIRNGFCREEWGLVYLEEPDEKMKALAGKILDERYCKVSKTLRDVKPILSRFAQKLAERRMLFHDDLRMIKKSLVKKGTEYGNEV